MVRKNNKSALSEAERWRLLLRAVALALAFLVGGLTLAIYSAGYRWHLSEKADRLRAEGRPVTAVVNDFYQSSGRGGGADTIDLSYTYEGRRYSAEILCGGGTGCAERPGPEMTVWVDSHHPSEFVAANGHTDDSVSFFNSWVPIVAGAVLGVIGCVMLRFLVPDVRRRAAKRRAGRA